MAKRYNFSEEQIQEIVTARKPKRYCSKLF